jgi:hypothetical protein
MAVQNLEVTTESILDAVAQMPEKEYEKFIKKVDKLRRKKPENPDWTKSEIKLIKQLNDCILSSEEQSRFNKLVNKRRNEKITESELKELIKLNEKSEHLNVKRLKILGKLADSKNKSLAEIMKKLEITPPKII